MTAINAKPLYVVIAKNHHRYVRIDGTKPSRTFVGGDYKPMNMKLYKAVLVETPYRQASFETYSTVAAATADANRIPAAYEPRICELKVVPTKKPLGIKNPTVDDLEIG